ncbi:MAG: hypothetical protein ACLFPH_09195, partial [Bacteroidales bacterium]
FVSLEFEGETYYGCDPDLSFNYYYATLNFYDVTETKMRLYNECTKDGNIWDINPSYILNEDIINFDNDFYKFQIINYDSFDGTELKLKFIESKLNNVPIGGTYTLEKQ